MISRLDAVFVTLLVTAMAVPTSAAETPDKKADPATAAYERAKALQAEGKRVEAEEAFLKVWQDFPGSKPALRALDKLWWLQADAGKTEEAFQHRVLWWQENLRMSGNEVPTEGPALRSYQARARWEVAEACSNLGNAQQWTDAEKLARARLVETLYVNLIKDYPESLYAKRAEGVLEELRRQIAEEEARQQAQKEIEVVIDKLNGILEKKDLDAFLALWSEEVRAKRSRELERVFKDPEYTNRRYRVVEVRFEGSRSRARVEADAIHLDSPDKKPGRVAFDFVKSDNAWRLGEHGEPPVAYQ